MEQYSFVLFQKIYDTNSLYNFDSSVMKVVEFQWMSGFYIQMDNLIGVIHQWYPNLRRGRVYLDKGEGVKNTLKRAWSGCPQVNWVVCLSTIQIPLFFIVFHEKKSEIPIFNERF